MSDKENREDFDWTPLVFLAVLVGATGLWLAWGLGLAEYVFARAKPENVQSLGVFGDTFGGINALFTAFAFAGVIWTAILQRKELRAQREELAETRRVFEAQAAVLARQTFDSIFFEVVRLFRETSNSMALRLNKDSIPVKGPAGLRQIEAKMYLAVAPLPPVLFISPVDKVLETLDALYEAHVYENNETELGPYYRTLYHTFKLIDSADMKLEEKVRYANIARSQLSADAVFLLAINGLTERGKEFKPLIERYGVLKHCGREELRPFLLAFWAPEAFAGQEGRKLLEAQRRGQLA